LAVPVVDAVADGDEGDAAGLEAAGVVEAEEDDDDEVLLLLQAAVTIAMHVMPSRAANRLFLIGSIPRR
jgi:hypothetical protein